MKLLVPLLLAVAAGVLNYAALSRREGATGSETFLQAAEDVAAGAPIGEGAVRPLPISGTDEELAALRAAAVPEAERATVVGNPAPRPLKKGDLILWRDTVPPPRDLEAGPGEKVLPVSLEGVTVEPGLLKVGREIGFLVDPGATAEDPRSRPAPEYVGPFRLLSVGAVVSPDAYAPAGGGPGRAGDRRVVSVAVKLDAENRLDARSGRLVAALSSADRRRIVAVLLDPAPAPAPPAGRVAGR